MKIKRILAGVILASCLSASLATAAIAVDYSFDGVAGAEFYPDTSYESVYGSRYNYGGINVVDYQIQALPYGRLDSTRIGVMEKIWFPGQIASSGLIEVDISGIGSSITSPGIIPSTGGVSYPIVYQPIVNQPIAYTSVKDMERTDGSIGTVKIPSLDINMKVWEGETSASMAKGLGHYSSTSGWDGNVGVCGHNRGAKYVIGSIKDLKVGDTITYTTIYGTRTYAVSMVKTIANNDWSYLQATTDNRITLTTCLANQPDYRICVQATEK